MTETGELRLAELLCARLCHDLASPVGAVVAGAELLADEAPGGMGIDAEALALLGDSAAAAAARLKFFRTAFGPAAGETEAAALRELVAGMLGGGLTLVWHGAGRLSGDRVRLVLNLALMGRDALPRGGSLTIEISQPSGMTAVTAEGPVAELGDTAAGLGQTSAANLTPRGAQARLTALLAQRLGGTVTTEATVAEGRQTLRLAVAVAE